MVFLLAVAVSNRAGALTLLERVRSGDNWRQRVAGRELWECSFCQVVVDVAGARKRLSRGGRETIEAIRKLPLLGMSNDGEGGHGGQPDGSDKGTHYEE